MSPQHAGRGDDAEERIPRLSSSAATRAWIVLLALVFLAFHLPYIPRSLEDLDSINFALGVRHFDVAQHQPHPPGYPVFIALAKAVHALGADELHALALVGIAAAALGVVAIGALFRRLGDRASSGWWTTGATALAVTSPLYWFSAVRPLSDSTGLAAAVAVQAMTLSNRIPSSAGAFAAGLATGIRSQVAWLTLPLLLLRVFDGWSEASRLSKRLISAALAFVAGVLLWLVPLVAIAGGPAAYWRALFNQGAEDFGNISMLWTTHTLRALEDAFYYAFVAPWVTWPVAAAMLAFAVVGTVGLGLRNRRALALLAAGFGPYLIFDLLFQETFTGRYALPLVVPIAYLAMTALRSLPRPSGALIAVAIAMFDAHVAGTSVAAFSREKAPAFRLLDDMASAARAASLPPVLAMDRRNAFDFRRPIVWAGASMPRIDRRLAAPPQHEWLEAAAYWNDGGAAPVWFVVDPKRAAIDLVQHGDPVRYRWALPYPELVSGARPNEMDWYRVERPDWYVGEGWSLTPEAAGIADADHRGLAYGPISARIAPSVAGGTVMVGGRNFESARPTRLSVLVDGRAVEDAQLAPGSFLLFAPLPASIAGGRYATLTLAGDNGSRVAIEQFDASAARPLAGFGSGWHEPEFNPRTGVRWRWLSARGELQLRSPVRRVVLHLEGESPRTYFSRGSRLIIASRGAAVLDRVVDGDFSIDVPIDDPGDAIVLETDQTYVPAERSRRTQDRRRLGLRIFRCEIRPAFAPGTAASSRPAR